MIAGHQPISQFPCFPLSRGPIVYQNVHYDPFPTMLTYLRCINLIRILHFQLVSTAPINAMKKIVIEIFKHIVRRFLFEVSFKIAS